MNKDLRIAVTGATGFAAGALLAEARVRGVKVLALSRSPRAVSDEHVEWVDCADGRGGVDYRRFGKPVDAVIHLAGRAHILKETAADPLAEYRKINVEQTLALARRCRELGVRRFIFVSSIGVNGRSSGVTAFTPQDTPAPHSPYARTKYEAELALQDLFSGTATVPLIVRPPLMYGPEVKGNFLRLIKLVDKGVPLPFSAVRNRRSILSVRNFADFLLTVAGGERGHCGIYLPADAADISTPALIRLIAQALGRKARLFPVWPALLQAGAALSGRSALYDQLCESLSVDQSSCLKDFGWSAPYAREDMILRTIEWYRTADGGAKV
ncbi:MAG TPA: NAD-dependent epimerase/dehydratase family protein [Gammaproteobacteria bacterium]|nr:NAD-dependent epimerase/dehydratase family protein [Gammaproteobacteria bacterium]